MTPSGVTWYVQSRGRRPAQDYLTWIRIQGPEREGDLHAVTSAGKRWETNSSLCAYGTVDLDGQLSLYMDGLVSPSWPTDAGGRAIRARLVALGDASNSAEVREILSTASSLLSGQDPGPLLTFTSADPGYKVDPAEITSLAARRPDPTDPPPSGEVRWGLSRSEAAQALSGYVDSGAELPRGEPLLIVSELLTAADQRSAAGAVLTVDEVAEPWHGQRPRKKSPAGLPRRPSLGCLGVLGFLILGALVLVLILAGK